MSDGKTTNSASRTALWVGAFAALAVLHRLVPYLFDLGQQASFAWNFGPVGALGLFAGARWRSRFAPLVPVAVMLLSHLLMWPFLAAEGHPTFSWMTPILYGSFAAYALIGRLIRGSSSPWWIGGAAVLGAVQFYLVTNFAWWPWSEMYTKDWAGLAACYAAGWPFF